jgi:hypothetical protein
MVVVMIFHECEFGRAFILAGSHKSCPLKTLKASSFCDSTQGERLCQPPKTASAALIEVVFER